MCNGKTYPIYSTLFIITLTPLSALRRCRFASTLLNGLRPRFQASLTSHATTVPTKSMLPGHSPPSSRFLAIEQKTFSCCFGWRQIRQAQSLKITPMIGASKVTSSAGITGRCAVCKRETTITLFKEALIPTYICSEECLKEYLKPLRRGKISIQTAIDGTREHWLD
jgi:hypothetical protein